MGAASVAIAGLVVGASVAPAQTTSERLDVSVAVTGVVMRGDTVRVVYAVSNLPSSRVDLWSFTVEVPGGAIRVLMPDANRRWRVARNYGGVSIAQWTRIGDHIPPGTATPPLSYDALGLPGFVTYYAEAYWPVPPYSPVDESQPLPTVTPRENLAYNARTGVTVGVVPLDPQEGETARAARLSDLTRQSCDLGWIRHQGVCHSLLVKVQAAIRALAQGRNDLAHVHLQALVRELEAQHGEQPGKHVSDAAFHLLRVNAEFVAARL